MEKVKRHFVCYWFHPPTGFFHINLGFHLDLRGPNIEIHLPFGFLRIGWRWDWVPLYGDKSPYKLGYIEKE